ncbi:MAG: hypothetical protein B7Z31_08990, partial [Rhodobacterales bacterium 12-65-15]
AIQEFASPLIWIDVARNIRCAVAFTVLQFWAFAAMETSALPRPISLGAEVVLHAFGSVFNVLTAVILTRAYRTAWPGAAPVAEVFA